MCLLSTRSSRVCDATRAARRTVATACASRHEDVLSRHVRAPTVTAMSTDLRHRLGRAGEDLALAHLERRGYALVARNHRTRFGELDLIVHDDTTIVFVEVKARRVDAATPPLQSIPPSKQRQVRRMAAAWLVESTGRPRARELRFDVIGVTVDRNGELVRLDHLEAAF
jgi:putative endonuclease